MPGSKRPRGDREWLVAAGRSSGLTLKRFGAWARYRREHALVAVVPGGPRSVALFFSIERPR